MLEDAAWVLGTCIPLLRGGAQSLDDGTQAPRIPEYLCREVTTKARELHRVSALLENAARVLGICTYASPQSHSGNCSTITVPPRPQIRFGRSTQT